MDTSLIFRRTLAARLVHFLTLAAAPSLAHVACGGDVSIPSQQPSSGGAQDDTPGEGGAGGQGGAEEPGGDPPPVPERVCIPASADGSCPSSEAATPQLPSNICGMPPQMVSAPELDPATEQCCYMIVPEGSSSCGTGRPFLVGARALHAAAVPGAAWRAADETAPDVRGLSAEARATLARAWTSDALLEHASVASFGRFALELLAVGAPPELVEAAHRAAIDEIRHARLCFALAGAYGGAPVGASAFPFGGAVAVSADLAAVAASAVREGCVAETLAAVLAAEQLGHAQDPAVRAALTAIAADEARHAELAWRAVAWAVATGGAEVRAAVIDAFAAGEEVLAGFVSGAAAGSELTAHGRLGAAEIAAALRRALDEVVRPAAAALLGASASPGSAAASSPSASLAV
ncbi:ferritin-like domain-containing protein [Sorangium sp. So ce726]|uniref:ferritin-like domain-containing protein n=1 Tax=Sorangium sp. So ce726 TaxID=3133319 RepID=UPI003F60D04B